MIRPAGTVMFQVQSLFVGKLLGKLGLAKYPLDPLRDSPGETHAAYEKKLIKLQNNKVNSSQLKKLLCYVVGLISATQPSSVWLSSSQKKT